MSAQSLMDPLTNTLNRRGLHQRLDLLSDKDGILLIADIDNFKSINDRFGHNTGDKVLLRVADTLHKQVRSQDIVSRYGGRRIFYFLCPPAL
ncbi:GGDEF domain-containing protein [Pseudoalteromonas sp. A601]|uniref:GGDEF domain-containing protein n=1 Tax=Pseudoalteromonas sp. A601 TaxID=1967839 RepID=UPI001594AD08|nr:GGDEF domain-containing protein [Pseudoalteromonas sp. A601]